MDEKRPLIDRLRFGCPPAFAGAPFVSGVMSEAADTIERQRTLISDMMAVMMNRLDTQEPKVKALLLRGIEDMPDSDVIPE